MFSGFWEAYEYVRIFIHATLRRELVLCPTQVYFTGHSLGKQRNLDIALTFQLLLIVIITFIPSIGGALATFAALDVSIHTIPRVNAYLKHKLK